MPLFAYEDQSLKRNVKSVNSEESQTQVMKSKFTYPVKEYRVIDGDSVKVTLDMGFSTFHSVIARLHGVDTPELRRRAQKSAGLVSKEFTENWFSDRWGSKKDHTVMFECIARDKYAGRVTGDFFVVIPNGSEGVRRFGQTVSNFLKVKQVARVYYGGKKKDWTKKELKRILDLKSKP